MAAPASTGPLMTLAEAAAYVRLAPKTLRNKLYAGRGPKSYHVGAGRQFRAADLDAWINRHAVPAGRAPRPLARPPQSTRHQVRAIIRICIALTQRAHWPHD